LSKGCGKDDGVFPVGYGKAGICRGASSHRNNAGWHDVTEIGRPLSGSGYQYQGRDELKRRVDIKMVSEPRGRQISDLLSGRAVLPWVAVEETGYDGKARSWCTFFDVTSGGYSSGTDNSSPTRSSISYIFEFKSARSGGGAWPGAVRTQVPKVGVDPERVVDRDTNQAVTTLPVPSSLKRY
jgi:hypothetical protein